MAIKTGPEYQMSTNTDKQTDTKTGRLWFNTHDTPDNARYIITLWPYRSLSVRGFRILMICLASLMSLIATGFFLIGAWPVIGFLGAEILIVWFAFKVNYRAGQLVEQLEITPERVEITRTDWRGTQTYFCLDSPWIRAELSEEIEYKPKLYLRAHAKKMEIGAFMPPVEKDALAKALNQTFMRIRAQS